MALSQANNYLAVNMHRLLSAEKENVFFSPYSISTVMAMLLCAAEDETERELRAALGYDNAGIKKDDITCTFEEQMSLLQKNSSSYTLACANSMLSQKDLNIKKQYKDILANSFKALLLEMDFAKDLQGVVRQINEFVKVNTKNMIPKFVQTLNPAAIIVLLNAVYFKGSWLQKFDNRLTNTEKFYNKGLKGKTKNVKMMHMKEVFLYTENESFQALQLPYIGEEVAMLVLLPRSMDGLESVESALIPSFVQEIKNNMRKQKVKVALPRFKLEYSKSLIPFFKELGVQRVFNSAQLGGAIDEAGLAVSEILHKAVLEVNEEGSEAAAATMVVISRCLVREPEFCANHPFAFVIYDTRSDLILFMGRVQEL